MKNAISIIKNNILSNVGVPCKEHSRKVTLRIPCRNSMQSGLDQTKKWKLDFEKTGKKWENPLMGWTSSSDSLQAVELYFDTKEEGIRYCTEQGWKYEVIEPNTTDYKLKSYAHNFKYSKEKLKLIRTK